MWLVLIGAVTVLPVDARGATLKGARAMRRRGDYEEAERAYRKLIGRRDVTGQARLGLARVLLETGRPEQTEKMALTASRGRTFAAALTLVAEARLQRGRHEAAAEALDRVLKRKPRHYRALIMRGLVHRQRGRAAQAQKVFDRFYDDYDARRIDRRSAEQLTYVGMACRYSGNFRDAADTLGDATRVDPGHLEAWIQWAEISLEKYDAASAESQYKKALAINPRSVEALVGIARVHLERDYDFERAQEFVRRALDVAPADVGARVIQARLLVDSGDHGAAQRLLEAALKHNPTHLPALSMLAANYFVADQKGAYQQVKTRVLALNDRYSTFFRVVAAAAERHHRYREAVALGLEAARRDPHDWYALAGLGSNYLRLGQEREGVTYLKKAWEGDQYNERNYRLLELYEEVLDKQYVFVRSRQLWVRVHRDEVALIKRVVIPEIRRAYAHYVRRFSFRPNKPLIVELYREPAHYAVRTVGLPRLDVLAVCFGRVITTTSPTLGRFNWAQVLWHELSHAFSMQLSRSRVPRWLGEGLAEMEPAAQRPEWRRESDMDLYRRLRAGTLTPVPSIHRAFSGARSLADMSVAYHQSTLLASYLVNRWGMAAVIKALRGYASGERTNQLWRRVTGLPLDQIDERFKEEQRARLTPVYGRGWFAQSSDRQSVQALRQRVAVHPRDHQGWARLALAQWRGGDPERSSHSARVALKLKPREKTALYVLASAALYRGRLNQAHRWLNQLVAAGGDGYFARLQMGRLALRRGDFASAKKHLALAKTFAPERVTPYTLLAGAYERRKRHEQAIGELKQVVLRSQQRYASAKRLVELLDQQRDYVALRRYGQLALHIQPGDATLHRRMARAFQAPASSPDLKRAIWHLQTALLCKPADAAGIHRDLAALYRRTGNTRAAKKHERMARGG